MRGQENVLFANIAATTATFALRGGTYSMDATATWGGGSVDLQRLAGDSATYYSVLPATFTANGYKGSLNLAPGTYKVVVTTATAVYTSIDRVPQE